MNELYFLDKHCKYTQHELCAGSWTSPELDTTILCECSCHKNKNKKQAIDRFEEPTSIAIGTSTSETEEDG